MPISIYLYTYRSIASTAINAAVLALVDAGVHLSDLVAAVTVGELYISIYIYILCLCMHYVYIYGLWVFGL
jgi:hypothetical protein